MTPRDAARRRSRTPSERRRFHQPYRPLYSRIVPQDRRRRAGARPGSLAPALEAAFAAERARLEESDNALSTIRAVNDSFAALDAQLERLAAVRLHAVRSLRSEGWSYDRLAAATGLSKARVAQLSRKVQPPGS